jgi:hypothetical protein
VSRPVAGRCGGTGAHCGVATAAGDLATIR